MPSQEGKKTFFSDGEAPITIKLDEGGGIIGLNFFKDQIRSNWIRPDHIRSDQIKLDQTRSN